MLLSLPFFFTHRSHNLLTSFPLPNIFTYSFTALFIQPSFPLLLIPLLQHTPKLEFPFPFCPCSSFPLTVSDVPLLFLQSSALLFSMFYTGRLRRKKLTAAQFSQTCSMVCNFDMNCCKNSGTFVQ